MGEPIPASSYPDESKRAMGFPPARRRKPLIHKTLQPLFPSGQGESRTHDTRIFSPLLYYLSYLSDTVFEGALARCEGRISL